MEIRPAMVERVAGCCLLAIVGAAVWWSNTTHLAARMAWEGMSPNLMVAEYLHPQWFAGDFPSGTAELLKSAPMTLYLIGGWLGIAPVLVMKMLIAVEIVLLAATTVWAVRRLIPEAGYGAANLAALLMITGSFRMADFGRWGDPYYGWVYSYAEAAIMAAAVTAHQRRLILCAVLLSVAFVCHPVLAIFGCAFVFAMLLPAWRDLDAREFCVALAIFVAVAGAYSTWVAMAANVGGGGIAGSLYVAVSRMETFHWYPVDMGLFWERHWERLFPFLAETLLLIVYFPQVEGEWRSRCWGLLLGFAALLALTAAGVVVSIAVPQPFLIKLALHRASSVYLMIALLFVAPGLWRDATGALWPRAVLAVLTIISCFTASYGVPALYGLALAGLAGSTVLGAAGWTVRVRILTLVSAILVALWLLYAAGGVADWHNQQYWGVFVMSPARLGLILTAAVGVALLRSPAGSASLLLMAVALMLGLILARSAEPFARYPELTAREEDYLAAQLWARDHTPVGSLFMPDPTHYYGWRDFSERPSFGNMREWLYSGWIYNSRRQVFDEGIRRVRALGLDPMAYLGHMGVRPPQMGEKLDRDVRRRYDALTADDLAKLSAQFGISYFVFDADQHRRPPGCGVVYSNSHYFILHSCLAAASPS